MDKKTIQKYKLEEAVKRFNQINEYTFITRPNLSEDGEEQEQPQDGGQQSDGQGGEMIAPDPQQNQQDPNTQAEAPATDNAAMQDGGAPVPTDGGQMPNDGSMGMPQEQPQDGNGMDMQNGEDFNVETDEMSPDDEVIDVDDLTNSQEATELKVDDVSDKLNTLLKVVDKFTSAIEQNDKKIEDLKSEFAKRNPTPEEKLNIRSQSSYPYSDNPKSFWDKVNANNPNYNVIYDNDVPANEEQKKFEITQKDIDNTNIHDIMKTFDEPLDLDDFIKF